MPVVYEDTRQQKGMHEEKRRGFEEAGYTVVRATLQCGDYVLPPPVSVDTKRSIQELAQNIRQQHERFRRECVRARNHGTRLVILVENSDGVRSLQDLSQWIEPMEQYSKRINARERLNGKNLAKSCVTMSDRYGVEFMFCHPSETARVTLEILEGGEDVRA